MLNGVDPVILFNFRIKPAGALASVLSKFITIDESTMINLPVIPLYLSERLTGIYIDSESKNIDVETNTETLSSGDAPAVTQRGIGSSVRIEMIASRDSIGLLLISAMSDLIFPKLTSKEYTISYFHGAVTVFNGLLHSFSISQNSNNDLYNISLELIKPSASKAAVPVVAKVTGTVPL